MQNVTYNYGLCVYIYSNEAEQYNKVLIKKRKGPSLCQYKFTSQFNCSQSREAFYIVSVIEHILRKLPLKKRLRY